MSLADVQRAVAAAVGEHAAGGCAAQPVFELRRISPENAILFLGCAQCAALQVVL
jgi:hypothetical protein